MTAALGRSQERARERRGGNEREWERCGAARGVVPGHPDEEGRGRQAGREVAWPAERARVGTQLLGERGGEDDRGGGGLGCLLAGPACCCWAAQGGAPGKLLLLLFFLFSNFSDICFDLVIILNQFIYLCQFLQGLTILF